MNGADANGKPYTTYLVERRPVRRRWLRIALWSVVGVVVVAAIAVAGSYIWLDRVMDKANKTPDAIKAGEIIASDPTNATAPLFAKPGTWNIILLGSDKRTSGGDATDEEYGRSDTIMILHVDPGENYVSVLSIPRDLRVEIPGHGLNKINAAYAIGGSALAIETVRWVTNLSIDYYINIDFDAFREVTTALGGIYVDVDRRYYHMEANSYENLDLQPGYQRLYGEDALDYVRFRHDINHDIGRIERQQSFLRAARAQISGWDLATKITDLVRLMAENTSTTLGADDVLRLAWFGLLMDNNRIKQSKIYGEDKQIDGLWYVVASDDSIRKAVKDLMTAPGSGLDTGGQSTTSTLDEATQAIVPAQDLTAELEGAKVEVLNANGVNGAAALAAGWLRNEGAEVLSVGDAGEVLEETVVQYPKGDSDAAEAATKILGTSNTAEDGTVSHIVVKLGQDFKAASDPASSPGARGIIYSSEYIALQTMVPFAMMGPTYMPEGYRYLDRRVYDVDTVDGRTFPAVKTIYQWEGEDQYLGFMQTTFIGAPAATAGEQVTANGLTYTIVGPASKVDYIWWQKDGVLYWVSNTISSLLSKEELLNVATGMVLVK